VELNTFAPVQWVELGDWVMGGVLALLLLTNVCRMVRFAMRGDRNGPIPFSLLVREVGTFLTHFAVQKKWRECSENRTRWLKHFLMMTGYLTMIVLIMIFLRWFQTDEIVPLYHPTRLFGYYATAVLLYVSADFLVGRMTKRGQIHKYSEASDWIFLVLMFLTALTGILVHILRLAGLPLATYLTYVIHLAIAVPFLVVEVPFGKWAHMLYRPLAACLANVNHKSRESAERIAEAA